MPSLYMINPAPSGIRPDTEAGWVSSPDLAIITVAAMAPAHWRVTVAEEAVQPVDLDSEADFIGLTGKSSQLDGIRRLSRHFRARGKVVLVGGPLASLQPAAVRDHADILVTGELEDIAPNFFADLEAGAWKGAYDGGRADITRSPAPRWDLYPVQRSMSGALQTTRGCPFECEFCDVIVYQGRKQRHKTLDQILIELDALHAAGFREVFLSDDNFAVHRKHARSVLEALRDWNARQDGPLRFFTQTSLDLARDPDLMDLCYAAGLRRLFVGVESANEASLRETRKRQNLLMPILQATERMVAHGLTIRAGLICGFDSDGPDIFQASYDFFQTTPPRAGGQHAPTDGRHAAGGAAGEGRPPAGGRPMDGVPAGRVRLPPRPDESASPRAGGPRPGRGPLRGRSLRAPLAPRDRPLAGRG